MDYLAPSIETRKYPAPSFDPYSIPSSKVQGAKEQVEVDAYGTGTSKYAPGTSRRTIKRKVN